ncbi:hypothetical protein DFJ63DRAFT_323768 [Scheffersomyces coipomensis]|uniref:uncharacterized protein n=1 Tax=Scheffersomyces coipomensis TaxID=1788519 RepID=UPI00315DA90F
MTSTFIPTDQLPLINPFLITICPGISPQLESNTHFSLKDEHFNNGELSINWPLNASNTTARLEDTYLNIARPPVSINSNESTTYVSLPYHITNLFKKVVKSKDKQMEGNIHIGANVNPLSHDPFKIINLNPGCLTNILDLNLLNSDSMKLSYSNNNNSNSNQDLTSKNPFNKLATNFNRLLKITSSGNSTNNSNNIIDPYNEFQSLLNVIENQKSSTNTTNGGNNNNSHLIHNILEYNPQNYLGELKSQTTSKLLISTNVNVLNVIAIDTNANYKFTKSITTHKPIIPFPEEQQQQQQQQSPSSNGNSNSNKPTEFVKVVEESLLRIQFRPNSIITSLKSVISKSREPLIVLGFDTGEIIILNLIQLNYQIFDDLGYNTQKGSSDSSSIHSRASNGVGNGNLNYSTSFNNVAVTTIELIHHHNFEMLILAGYANGEVLIIDPFAPKQTAENKDKKSSTASTYSDNSTNALKYNKRIVGKDSFITYFKKFDLSPFTKNKSLVNAQEDHYTPNYLIGHFKLSLKPITSITSTLLYSTYVASDEFTHKFDNQPMIIAIGGDDGIIRFIDLIFTYNRNYGISNPDVKTNSSILTDLLSNYFNDGITDVEFSPDFRFICVVGKGDLIEIFKMSYYNVNGLLSKNSSNNYNTASTDNIGGGGSINITAGRRSRSGTVNSVGSNNPQSGPSGSQLFLSPISTAPSNSYDATRNDHNGTPRLSNYQAKELYPPLIKEVKIVGRFKGHTNTIRSIKFLEVEDDELERSGSNNVTYKLVSCGFDGKVIIWEFDYKALPKVKKLATPAPAKKEQDKDHKKKSADQLEIVTSLYKSLFDLRLKRHYRQYLKKGVPLKFNAVIPPIVNDKLVPSIRVPLLSLDLSSFIHDGKIDGFYLDSYNFWIFGKSGDIFKYTLK